MGGSVRYFGVFPLWCCYLWYMHQPVRVLSSCLSNCVTSYLVQSSVYFFPTAMLMWIAIVFFLCTLLGSGYTCIRMGDFSQGYPRRMGKSRLILGGQTKSVPSVAKEGAAGILWGKEWTTSRKTKGVHTYTYKLQSQRRWSRTMTGTR